MTTQILDSFAPSPILISVAVILLFYCVFKYFQNRTTYNYPPGPRGIPFFGYFPNLENDPQKLISKFSEEYGDIFTIKIAGRPYIFLNSYESIKEAYVTNGSSLSNRSEDYNVFAQLFDSKAFAFINGDEWKLQRKLFSSALKSEGNLESRILEVTHQMIEEIKVKTFDSNPVDLYNTFTNSIINVVGGLVCGQQLAITDPESAEMILRDSREAFGLVPGTYGFLSGIIIKLITYIATNKQKKIVEICERQFNLMKRFIAEHQETFDPENVRDYIDLCLKEKLKGGPENQWFSLEHMAANMFVFYVGGTDSTSSAIYFATLMMVKHPETQKKCQNEIDQIVGPDESISFRDRERLPYVEAVINEVLRYTTYAAVLQCRCTTEEITLQGYHIPANTDILANLWTATRDKNIWANPAVFDPNNFYEKEIPRDLASLPFSTGKRICPGERLARMEIFLFFTALLQNFHLSFPPNENVDDKYLSKFDRILSSFKVIATPR